MRVSEIMESIPTEAYAIAFIVCVASIFFLVFDEERRRRS